MRNWIALDISIKNIFNNFALQRFVWFSLHHFPIPQYFLHSSKELLASIVISSLMEEKQSMYRLKSLKVKAFSFCVNMVEAERPRKTFARYLKANTVKPLLSGPPIKQTPSIKRTLSRSRNERFIFPFITNPYSADTCIKRTRTLK